MENINMILEKIDNFVWGPWMLIFLLGTGIFLMLKLRFLPIRRLGFALLCVIGRETKKEMISPENMQKSMDGLVVEVSHGMESEQISTTEGVSSFSSLTTELAATIGIGNIVGVATAMVLGGPGALLWMILSSIIGMATKLVESTLAVKYRTINDKWEYVGGPMYTLANGFPHPGAGRLLGGMFAVFAIMASFGMGNMTQSNSIAEAMRESFRIPQAKTGLVLTILTILVVLGGIGSIAKVTQVMVPFMGAFYVLGAMLVILTHLQNLGSGVRDIFAAAFTPYAAAGGVFGTLTASASDALRWGVSRGVFSNEAGLGAAGITAACAKTNDYIKQGYISMTGVFFDTIVICAITGLALTCSGMVGTVDALGDPITGTALTIAAFETTFGKWGGVFITVSIALFAFATIIAWAYQGEKAFEFLVKKSKYCIWYRFAYALIVFVGAVCSLDVVWNFSDICNGLMVVPNLIGVLVLSGEICREIIEYDE